jgi:hypothetical protein
LYGALTACASKLRVLDTFINPSYFWATREWDNATDTQRRAYALKMARYNDGDRL